MSARLFHYEFLDGRLIGSEAPDAFGGGRTAVEAFAREHGASVLLTLTVQWRDWQVVGLVQHHVPMAGYPTRSEVAAAHRILGAHLARGETVWVHCQAGIDRTGTVIGAWLAALGHPPGEVCSRLLEKFPAYRRQPAFIDLWAPCRDRIHEFAAAADDAEPGSG